MKKLTKADLQDLFFRLQEEANEVLRVVREKGWKHYQGPLMAAFGVLLIVYLGAYRATAGKRARLESQIAAERSRSEYAETYELMKARMLGYYAKMPKPDQKDGWLFNKVLASATEQGIILESIGSQDEKGTAEFWVLSIPVSARVTYPKLGKWMEALENNKPSLYVTRLEARRPEQAEPGSGVLEVNLVIATLMPKKVQRL